MASRALDLIIRLIKQGAGGQQAASELGTFERALGTVNTALQVFAVERIGRAVVELGNLGLENQRAELSFQRIVGGADLAESALRRLEEATEGEISRTDLMVAASTALSAGLVTNTTDLERMYGAASSLSDYMGTTAQDMISRYSQFLETGMIRSLRGTGLNLQNVEDSMRELEDANTGLSDSQIRFIALMEETDGILNTLGTETIPNNLDAVERLNVSWENLKTAWGEMVAGPLGDLAQGMADIVDVATDLSNEYNRLGENSPDWRRLIPVVNVIDPIWRWNDAIRNVRENSDGFNSAADAYAARLQGMATAYSTAASAAGDLETATLSATDIISLSADALREAGVEAERAARLQEALAVATGAMSAEELVQQQRARDLATAYADGNITMGEYIAAIQNIGTAWSEVPEAVQTTYRTVYEYEGAPPPVGMPGGPMGGWAPIGYQHGTDFAPGGMALVGEAGPELVSLPRGSRVFSAAQTRQMVDNRSYSRGGDTFIVQDRLAAAMIMERGARQRMGMVGGG